MTQRQIEGSASGECARIRGLLCKSVEAAPTATSSGLCGAPAHPSRIHGPRTRCRRMPLPQAHAIALEPAANRAVRRHTRLSRAAARSGRASRPTPRHTAISAGASEPPRSVASRRKRRPSLGRCGARSPTRRRLPRRVIASTSCRRTPATRLSIASPWRPDRSNCSARNTSGAYELMAADVAAIIPPNLCLPTPAAFFLTRHAAPHISAKPVSGHAGV